MPFHITKQFLVHYVSNKIIANIPFYAIRHAYYRAVCRIKIGKRSSIHMNTFIEGNKIVIGRNTVINRSCYLDGRGELFIGDNVSISPHVHIITVSHDMNSPEFQNIYTTVKIKNYVWIGSRATILPGVCIGEGAVVGAGSLVSKDVEPYTFVAGVPAKKIKDRNKEMNYNPSWLPYFD